jgi:hypothetical protein
VFPQPRRCLDRVVRNKGLRVQMIDGLMSLVINQLCSVTTRGVLCRACRTSMTVSMMRSSRGGGGAPPRGPPPGPAYKNAAGRTRPGYVSYLYRGVSTSARVVARILRTARSWPPARRAPRLETVTAVA